MQVKRFVAADMRRALELVRQELGPNAVILSSQRHPKGVELLTTLEQASMVPEESLGMVPGDDQSTGDESPLVSDAAWGEQAAVDNAVKAHFDAQEPTYQEPAVSMQTAFSGRNSEQLAAEIEQARERMFEARKAQAAQDEAANPDFASHLQQATQAGTAELTPQMSTQIGARTNAFAGTAKSEHSTLTKPTNDDEGALQSLQEELASMRTLLHEQLGRMSYGHMATHTPVQAKIWRRFSRMGLSANCAESVLNAVAMKDYQTIGEAWPAAIAALSHQVPALTHDVAAQGGVVALVGPTGAGKTTTIGKLAARHVLNHGADSVALVTIDTYRLAAHDQLRSLGRILGVSVKVVSDHNELPAVLASLADCSLVLIDTAGLRHSDPLLTAQLASLKQNPAISSYLVLPSNSQTQMMRASIQAYQAAGLRGCVLSKLDETASLGEAIGVIAESALPLAYTTDGQHIPNDISLAKPHQLVTRAVALMKQNPIDEERVINDFASVALTVPQSPLNRTAEHL